MPVTIRERVKSRRFRVENGEGAGTLMYLVMGTNSEDEARGAVVANTPTGMFGLSRLNIDCDPLGAGMWDAEVAYGTRTAAKGGLGADTPTEFPPPPPPPGSPPDPPPAFATPPDPLPVLEPQPGAPGDGSSDPSGGTGGAGSGGTPAAPPAIDPAATIGPEWSFDTSGGTKHLTKSIQTVYARKVVEDGDDLQIDPETGEVYVEAPDLKGAIGASRDGVAGVDVVDPKLEITTTRVVRSITLNYLRTLCQLTGGVNNATFMGFPEGEVLFLGATGTYKEPDGWSVVFKFSLSPNETDIELVPPDTEGGDPTLRIPAKQGHDYLWVAYGGEVVAGAKKGFFQTPKAAYVERVYYRRDFTKLGWK